MDRIPAPDDLRGAASVARALAYVVGLAGVVAGAIVYAGGDQTALAVVVWVITFAAGAILMIAAFLTDGLAALLARTAQMEQDLRVLLGRQGPGEPRPDQEPWSSDHPNPW